MRMPPKELDSRSYHQKYLNLKKKFKALLYENESFQEELRKSQRKLVKISRDKSFLLDRLLKYENVDSSTTDSEATVSSDSDVEFQVQIPVKKRIVYCNKKKTINHSNTDNHETFPASASITSATNDAKKKKSRKPPVPKMVKVPVVTPAEPPKFKVKIEPVSMSIGDGHMTSEEIERHLEAKQSLRDLMPEKTPLTLPIEIFSNDPSEMECEILD